MEDNEKLRYPVGRISEQEFANEPFSETVKDVLLLEIKMLPSTIEMSIQNLDEAHLQTPYRPGGWTVNQVVHHLADSHINAYTRFKLGLTESNPIIQPYDQDLWAQLPDNQLPVNISITLLHALHARWFALLKSLKEEDWQRTIFHPEEKIEITLWQLLKNYAWHGRHHVAHIMQLRERNKW